MNKPEKKEITWMSGVKVGAEYNEACEDWEAFLPSVKEIEGIISNEKPRHSMEIEDEKRIAKAIAKRIGRS